ncbi:MAG TPA: universal stress protein [Ktedonobacteraceae bacterium]|nr:universal stress protein [Ktedonobacteraceae bacterium]
MQSQVIVPLDGSASAEAILPHALLFAQWGQSILTLLQIVTPSGLPGVRDRMIPDNWSEGEEIWGKDYLATMARRLQSSGVTVQTRHPQAALAEQAIVSYTKQQPRVQLIALTTPGRSAVGRTLFGSVAEQVFASVPTSLLLLHPPKSEQTTSGPIVSTSYQAIIVLLDDSIEAEQALRQATSLAQACQATLVLVAVPPRPGEETFVAEAEQPISGETAQEALNSADSLEDKAQLLRTTAGLRVETATAAREPEAFLEQISGHGQSNLLVVATREQALFGAEKFLRHRNVPVLLLAKLS